ncbi:DUF1501 domain-containing protein [Coralloluteibacterium stylophorae]|uniref:DUF1501 domain-containing protein n=1 Tax=Coralloluteibacterium stylophorae TaxID=1776034 RepID=A0A8J8AWW6_9GAMM|nr:DUF1501 domain-containing protein [Coralloluteibacterium stylophorae]MBS7457068.1 DUF1501 domain-containing protein [Coralloluteibacterium stylophorae]
MSTVSRRDFLKGCGAAFALGSISPGMLIAAPSSDQHDTLIHVFLRGGFDGLNLVLPVSGDDRVHYEQARPSLSIATSGAYGALALTTSSGQATGFGLHPSAQGLHDIWNDGKLAIVHAAGLRTVESRSHFDTQAYLDLGTPGSKTTASGWITRAWANSTENKAAADLPLLAVMNGLPQNLMGATNAVSLSSPSDFQLNAGPWQWQQTRSNSPAGLVGVNETLIKLWQGSGPLARAGQAADHALKVVQAAAIPSAPSGWPTSTFAKQLWTVAEGIRTGLGVRFATIDLGGWDTHEGQGTAGSGYHYWQNKIAELSAGLYAFYEELERDGRLGRVTVVVQSEFGRRVRQNANGGTDHGYGNPLLVIGGNVNGRRFFGRWPGLDPEILSPYYGDVPVTTDYRQVMAEILARRLGVHSSRFPAIFPGYTSHTAINVINR